MRNYTLSVLVEDEAGVLSGVSRLFNFLSRNRYILSITNLLLILSKITNI